VPFGPDCNYATFDDCVKANSGKKNPKAYCAEIMRATEEHCKQKARDQFEFEYSVRERDTQVNRTRPIGRRPWTWDIANARYVDADGNPLPYEDLRQMLYRYLEEQRVRAEQITQWMFDRNAGGNVPEWEFQMREIIKDAYGAAYMLGRGGRFQMSYRDWSYLGRAVSEQYRYLNNFAAQVVSRPFNAEDVAQAVRRANLYPLSARQVMQRGYTYARGVPELPYYPGDGSTPCLGNCGCHWDIEETATGWDCYWRLGKADNCEECPKREVRDSPLRVAAQG